MSSLKFNLPCILCWDEGVVAGVVTELPGYPPEFLALPGEERARLSKAAICAKHAHLKDQLVVRK